MDTMSLIGRWFYGIATIAFGAQHLVYGDFVTRVVPWWPAWIPGRPAWAYAVGAMLIAAGAAMLLGRRTGAVATVLGSSILASFVFLGLPLAAGSPALSGAWTVAGKALALSGGAFLVARAASIADARSGSAASTPLRALWSPGPWFFGAFLTLCGIQHFVHLEFVMSLVPRWVPGALFWTCFTGVALIAAGIGVLVQRTAWLAGMLSGLMIFLWVLMLHVPRAFAAGTRGTNETTAVFEALAMSGIALLVASTVAPRQPLRVPAQAPRGSEMLAPSARAR